MAATESRAAVRHFPRLRAAATRLKPRANRPSTGELAIWTLNAAMIAAGTALFVAGPTDLRPIIGSTHVPFWALLVGFAAAERFVVHVHFRHSAHSMSLGEIPLVFGLVFANGHDVILAGVIGRLVVVAVQRKLPPIRLAFNLGLFFLGNCLAVLVFHAVASPGDALDPLVWAAAGLATAASSVAATLLIGAAVSLSEGLLSVRQMLRTMTTDLLVTVANASIALCAAKLVYNDWTAAFLIVLPITGMFATYRAYLAERQRHERLEFLYEAARTLSISSDIGSALQGLLARALEAFRAEVAEFLFYSPDGGQALRTTVQADGSTAVLENIDPVIAAELRSLIERQGLGAAAMTDIADGRLSGYLESRNLSNGLFAALKGEHSWIGAMVLGNPSGVVHTFSQDDLKLFETLANNTSVALENDRRGQTVWKMMQLQRDLEHQASHDPLTDLANRLLFADRVGEALENGRGKVSVIFIDIDDFKTVNDSLGHAAGDELLVAVARRLSDCVRPSDIVARLGGDEFAVMLELGSSEQEAIDVVERIISRLGERFAIAGQSVSVRGSAGIATGNRGEVSPDELIRNADVAMYRAKQAGKHTYQVFQRGMEVPVLRRHGLKQRLRDAVRDESFLVHYQPIVALETREVVACEALVRWLDGPRGPIPPQSFIPIAEEMGVIIPIGRSVLKRACADAQRWHQRNAPGPVLHVNLSPVELYDSQFLPGVIAVLEETGLSPERLVFEITEGVVLREPERCIRTLEALHTLGVGLALDDFGTGYSSLSHLRSLPIDWLKVGKPFVDSMEPGGVDRPFVHTIIELAASLAVGVVAEGIETRGQLRSLRELGCGYGQGFYLGSPAALEPSGRPPQLEPDPDVTMPLRLMSSPDTVRRR